MSDLQIGASEAALVRDEPIRIGRRARLPVLPGDRSVPVAPTSVQLALTEACPMRCVHCDLWKTKRQHEELATEEWIEVLDDLADWLPNREVHFTGGEPFLRRDFLSLLSYASLDKGLTTSANTSGVLIRESTLVDLVETGINGLVFSFDGIGDLHGEIRGNPHTFERNLRWIEYLRHHFFITIATVIMKKNLHQLADLVRFAAEVGASGIAFQPLFQNFGAEPDAQWYRKSPLWPDDLRAVDRAIDDLVRLKDLGEPILNSRHHLQLMKEFFRSPEHLPRYRCLVGDTNLAISPYGEVRLCYQMDPIGNVRTSTVRSLWTSTQATDTRQVIDSCSRSCSIMNCNYNDV